MKVTPAIETTGNSCTHASFWLAWGAKQRKKRPVGILAMLRGIVGGSK